MMTISNAIERMQKLMFLWLLFVTGFSFAQNQNLSNGNIFDGEPYLAINPGNPQHLIVAWMSYLPYSKLAIKTRVSFDGGQSWSAATPIAHTHSSYSSADPSLAFDQSGHVFLSFADYDKTSDSGAVYVVKSTNGGLSWTIPVEVINANFAPDKPIDRPWMSIDKSGGLHNGNIYISTMPPTVFGYLPPPYHPYLSVSVDGGVSFQSRCLDTANFLAGQIIRQPMASNCVASDGTFYAVFPGYVPSQNPYPQYFIASSENSGLSLSYHTLFASASTVSDSLAKTGYLIIADPSNASHLCFFFLGTDYGDVDVLMRESFDKGLHWSGAIRINDDPAANNRMQDLLWADFDDDGDLAVAWRDRRNALDSGYAASSEIWAAVRNKNSANFSANFKISDTLVPYGNVLSLSGNDFMCLKFVHDTLFAVWGDIRNTKMNIWFQKMTKNGQALFVRQISSEQLPNIKIFPNPVMSGLELAGTKIKEIRILNHSGKLVLLRQYTKPVEKAQIDASRWPSGVYVVQVLSQKGEVVRKIIKR